MVHRVRLYIYPELGIAYTQESGETTIEHKFVFPQAAEHPFGPACIEPSVCR